VLGTERAGTSPPDLGFAVPRCGGEHDLFLYSMWI
jgi:hypothetical protein